MEIDMTSNEYDSVSPEALTETLASIAVESWRITKVFDRLLGKIKVDEQERYRGQLRWFVNKIEEALDEANLRIVNVEGHTFDPGMAATPLNIEEFDSEDTLVVKQMLEPIIMDKEGLIKTGTVILRKA